MPGANTQDLKRKVEALQLNAEGLLKLLGRDAEARATFWEKLKGITTPQEMRLVDNVLNTINEQVRQAEEGTKTLIEVAGEAAKGAAR